MTVAGFRVLARKTPTTKQQAKPRQLSPPHAQNTEPPRNTLNRDSLPATVR